MFDRKTYQDTFAQVHASEETLSEVLNMTRKNKSYSGVRLTRMLVAAVIIAGVLATTAFAYVGFTQYENPMVMLKSFFGAEEYTVDEGTMFTYQDEYYYNEYQTPTVEHVPLDEDVAEDVAQYISDVGKSITYGNDTLTVEAHQYDSATDCGIIYYTVENPEGVTGYETQYDGEVWWPGGELICINHVAGKNYIMPDETTSTKLSVAFYYAAVFEGESNAELSFYDDSSNVLVLPLDDGGGMDYLTFGDNEIIISAIGIRIFADKMEFLREYDTDGTLLDPMVDNIESLIIRYIDGTEYVVDFDRNGNRTENYAYSVQDMECKTRGYTFNRLVNVKAVEAVLINDVEYLVNE